MTEPTPEEISKVMRHISLKADPKNKVRDLGRSHFVEMAKKSWESRRAVPPIPFEEWKKQQEAKKAKSPKKRKGKTNGKS